jgi:hypothetical protein
MNTTQKIASIALLSALFGCSSIPSNTNRDEFRSVRNQTINVPTQYISDLPNVNANREEFRSYRDQTMSQPNRYFMETPESKSVLTSSAIMSQANGCTYMTRYKIRTNADFTSSLNLFKYRAALMGAERVVLVKHEEIDASENKIIVDDHNEIYLRAGTTLQGAEYHSTIVGDLYDCSK